MQGVLLMLDEVPPELVALDFSVSNFNNPRGDGSDFRIVRDQNNGASLRRKFVKEVENALPGDGIEITGRFVGEDELGIIYQGPSDGDALTLSAGELKGAVVHAFLQAHPEDGCFGALTAFFGGKARINHRELYVFENVEAGQKIEGLEDESDAFVAHFGEFIAAGFAQINAVNCDGAGAGCVQSTQQMHERGFAASAGSDDGGKLTGFEFEIHAVEGKNLLFADDITPTHIVKFDQCHWEARDTGGRARSNRVRGFRISVSFQPWREVASGGFLHRVPGRREFLQKTSL